MALNAADSTTTYHNEFQEHLEAFQKHLAGVGDKPLSSSFIEPSGYWSPSEKEKFFHSLSVNTRFRPDLIALDVKSKTVTDVCIYLDVLEEASAQVESIRDELDIAMAVPNAWVTVEEEEAGRLEDPLQKVLEEEGVSEQGEALYILDARRMKLADRILQESYELTNQNEDTYLPHSRPSTPPPLSHTNQETDLDTDPPEPSQSQMPSSLTIAEPTTPEPETPLSPNSRRRLYKRMYMRRKRAGQTGSALNTSTAKLQPGRKGQRRARDYNRVEGDMDIDEETGESISERLEGEWDRLGINGDALLSRDLGLFHLEALRNLMRISSTDNDAPSSITATTVQAMDAIVKNFVSDVMQLSIALREEELRIKGRTKVWHSNDEIWASTVNHALSVMGRTRPHGGDASIQVSPVEPDDDNGDGTEGPSGDSTNTTPYKSTKLRSDYNELPFFCRIPKEFRTPEDLLELETDDKALAIELDGESAIEDRDLNMELRYKEELEARYNQRLQP